MWMEEHLERKKMEYIPQERQIRAEQAVWQYDYARINEIILGIHDCFLKLREDARLLDDTMDRLNAFYTEIIALLDKNERKTMDAEYTELRRISRRFSNFRQQTPNEIFDRMDKFFKELMILRQKHGLGIPASIRRSLTERTEATLLGKD